MMNQPTIFQPRPSPSLLLSNLLNLQLLTVLLPRLVDHLVKLSLLILRQLMKNPLVVTRVVICRRPTTLR